MLEVAGVLHWDVSPSNLFFAPVRNRTNHCKFMDHIPGKVQQHLCQRIENPCWQGILGNWGYAVPVSPSSSTVTTFQTSDNESSLSDCPLTSPIEAESVIEYNNLVPTWKIGSHDVPLLVSALNLMADDDIMLLMGTDNPDNDPRQTIDLCLLYCMVSLYDFVQHDQTHVQLRAHGHGCLCSL